MTENKEQEEAEQEVKEVIEEPVPAPPAAPPAAEEAVKETPEETQKAEDLISKANTAAARQEDANEQLKNLLDREEAMKVEVTLGGRAAAGSKTQSKEEKEIESTKEFLKGTGYEEDLFPEKKQ